MGAVMFKTAALLPTVASPQGFMIAVSGIGAMVFGFDQIAILGSDLHPPDGFCPGAPDCMIEYDMIVWPQ